MANGSLTAADAGRALRDAGKGAVVGGAIGSVVPGVGTAVGSGVGAVVGGLTGLFSGGPTAHQYSANAGGQSIDARQIWQQINPGSSSSLDDGASAAGQLQSVHQARVDQINQLNQTMDAAWQGDSSAQAQAGAHPLGVWLQDSANNLKNSSKYLGNQSSAFHTVHNNVTEIAATPPSEGFWDSVNPFSDKDDEINKYNQQGQANVDAYNAYYQASVQNAAGMPQFKAWTGNTFSDGNGNGNGGNGGGGSGGGGGGGGVGGGSGGGAGNPPHFGTGLPTTHLPTGGGGGTGSGGGHPINPNPPTATPPGAYQPPNWNDGTSASNYTPPNIDSGGFGPGGSSGIGAGGAGAGGIGAGGAGAGAGGFGGGVAGFGPGAAGALSAGASTGAGASGSSSGDAYGAAGARAGTTGAAGRSGMSSMGRGGGKGEGAEDEEHETKYLVSDDPNELFGTDELTAPPVIGE